MSSPLNDPSTEDWFCRFDAAARHLPAEDRAAQHEELRQHLDALTAANVAAGQSPEMAQQNALTRLGDPFQIGRKLNQEWQQSRTGFRADMKAIGFGFGLYLAAQIVVRLSMPWLNSLSHLGLFVVFLSLNALRNATVGRKYPLQALRASLYSEVLGNLCFWGTLIAAYAFQHPQFSELWAVFTPILSRLLLWITGCVTLAYLASVTRRGWYRPTLAEFKVSLPRRRAVSRG